MNIEAFMSAEKSIIIAPAGYGKTYTIAEAIAAYRGSKKVLVLTHTHSGIASLREKFEQRHLVTSTYHLDTICSFALNLTKSYHINKDEIPTENDTSAMFDFAVQHAELILKARPIKQLISTRYEHLIVDEYQDCTLAQHKMLMELSQNLKTHLLGDPLQGIFGFRGQEIVDFNDVSFVPFKSNCQVLDTPWRWRNAGQDALGHDLSLVRDKLLANQDIDLRDYPSICLTLGARDDYAIPKSSVWNRLSQELKFGCVIIYPNNTSVESRKAVVKRLPQIQLLESIDGKDYYNWCSNFDIHSGQQIVIDVADMMRTVCKKSIINTWIKVDGTLVNKRKPEEKVLRDKLEAIISSLTIKRSYRKIADLIVALIQLKGVIVYRKDFVKDILNTLIEADRLGLTASEAIVRNRNLIRRKGRKVSKNSIGTTLLTKGLEFDNVLVLNAQDIKDPRHLYVALSRCRRRLVVITDRYVLHPYN